MSCDYLDPSQASVPSSSSSVLSEFLPALVSWAGGGGGGGMGGCTIAVVFEQLLLALTHHTTQGHNLQRQKYSVYSVLASTTMSHSVGHSLLLSLFLSVGVFVKQGPCRLGTQQLPDSASQDLRLHFYSWPPLGTLMAGFNDRKIRTVGVRERRVTCPIWNRKRGYLGQVPKEFTG